MRIRLAVGRSTKPRRTSVSLITRLSGCASTITDARGWTKAETVTEADEAAAGFGTMQQPSATWTGRWCAGADEAAAEVGTIAARTRRSAAAALETARPAFHIPSASAFI